MIPDPGFTGINIIPDGPTLYILSQLKEKDLSNIAQVSRRFNRLTEQHREVRYIKKDFDTLTSKVIFGTDDFVGIRWLARRHPERRCSSKTFNWASSSGYTEIIKLLLAADKPCTDDALDCASENGHTDIVKLLLAAGSPYSDCTKWAIDFASGSGHIEIVKLLLAANKPCSKNALRYAFVNGQTEIVKLLE